MPKTKKDAIDDIVSAVEDSAASVDDSPEIKTDAVEIDETLDPAEFITKDALEEKLEAFSKNFVTVISDLFKKEVDVHHDFSNQAPGIPSQELGQDSRGIEPVAANDLIPQADLEAFMNQILLVYIHPSQNKEDNPVLTPSVNGRNQPIIRGQNSQVKRKYVEVLARNRHTGYDQIIDPLNPEKYVMQPCMVVKDPFTVRHDPSPRGSDWLYGILSEA